MNYRTMVEFHQKVRSDVTVASLPVPIEDGKCFGVMRVDQQGQIISFDEKPQRPFSIPGQPDRCLASMGIYVFTARFLFEQLIRDATDAKSSHDFGKDIIPRVVNTHRVFAFPFRDENRKSTAYWRDVGTIDAYYEANMDLTRVDPMLNLYDQDWPVRTKFHNYPPPKFVFAGQDDANRLGTAIDSIVCPGCIVSGGRVERSILGYRVRVNSYSTVHDSILFDGVNVGRHAKIRRAIIDKDVQIPQGCEIGYDRENDLRRGFTISSGGVVVIGKSDTVLPSSIHEPLLV
jgi:glucose-1-phosphate adenylyltransferase